MKLVNAGFKSKEEARAAIDAGGPVYRPDGRQIQVKPVRVWSGNTPYCFESSTPSGWASMSGMDWGEFEDFKKPMSEREALIDDVKNLPPGTGVLCWFAVGSPVVVCGYDDNSDRFITLGGGHCNDAHRAEIDDQGRVLGVPPACIVGAPPAPSAEILRQVEGGDDNV